MSCLFVNVPELICYDVFETFEILLAILSSVKSPVASIVFWMTLFGEASRAVVADFLAWLRSFWLNLLLKFLLIFLQIFLGKGKNP